MKRIKINDHLQLQQTDDGYSMLFSGEGKQAIVNMSQVATHRGRITESAMLAALEETFEGVPDDV